MNTGCTIAYFHPGGKNKKRILLVAFAILVLTTMPASTGAAPAATTINRLPPVSFVNGTVEVECENGYAELGTGSVDFEITGAYTWTFPDTPLSSGTFSLTIPETECNSGGCFLNITNVTGLTNLPPGALCPANGDTHTYPPLAGWTYANQPTPEIVNILPGTAATAPQDANVGTLTSVPGSSPNAVTISTVRADSTAMTWPLIAGIALLTRLWALIRTRV